MEVDLWIHYKNCHGHIWGLTDDNTFQCVLNCGKKFIRSQDLKQHQDLKHSRTLQWYFGVCVKDKA